MNRIRTSLLDTAVFLACCFMAGALWVLWPVEDDGEAGGEWI